MESNCFKTCILYCFFFHLNFFINLINKAHKLLVWLSFKPRILVILMTKMADSLGNCFVCGAGFSKNNIKTPTIEKIKPMNVKGTLFKYYGVFVIP